MVAKQEIIELNKDFSKCAFYMIQKLAIYTDQLSKNFFEIRGVDITHDEFVAINQILNTTFIIDFKFTFHFILPILLKFPINNYQLLVYNRC